MGGGDADDLERRACARANVKLHPGGCLIATAIAVTGVGCDCPAVWGGHGARWGATDVSRKDASSTLTLPPSPPVPVGVHGYLRGEGNLGRGVAAPGARGKSGQYGGPWHAVGMEARRRRRAASGYPAPTEDRWTSST